MKFTSVFAMVAVAASLVGCAASGPSQKEMEAKMPALKADQGRVYFYRNASFVGGGLAPDIKLDGAVVGESKQGGFFYVDTASGKHEASTSTEAENKLSFVLENGEIKYVRTKVAVGILVGRVVPELVGADEAKKEIAETAYTGK